MSSNRADATGLVIGGEPRIDFLPPEVKAGKEAKRTRRSVVALVLLVVAACVAGYVFSATLAGQAQAQLSDAQDRTRTLIQEQGEFNEVRAVTSRLAASANARLVGSANEVMWAAYLQKLVAALPSGSTVTRYMVESPSFGGAVSVPEAALQGPTLATIDFVATFPNIVAAKNALKGLEALDGYTRAWVTPISLDDEGTYSANFTLAINADVLERRFFTEEEQSNVAEEAVGAEVAGADSEAERE